MKKIVFFDGDGTLWYPRATKRKEKPHWIYHDPDIKEDYKAHLMLTPKVVPTLRALRKLGIKVVVLSTHPQKPKEADAIVHEKVRHFRLEPLFDEVHAARNVPKGKGAVMLRVLKRLGLPKSAALMVGDSYVWDYLAAKSAGIDGVLMESTYLRSHSGAARVRRVIKDLSGVLRHLA